ncbi:hypothetical protein TcasGA2_TC003813 [Tribolium castaneum]|uniref:Uncharacterized protein n=1 Tax=Tribolium castaneum TaxID=7070 RepID=D6WF52_TRICA|nr:hypothetical protein TcasGA2_TC003813 [Tribolium castaneum]
MGTKPPVDEFSEYRDVDAKVSMLEQREQNREADSCGGTLSLLTGCKGSTLLDEDDDRSTPVSANTVSYFRKLAKLAAGLMRLPELPFCFTRGVCVSEPLFRRRFTSVFMPGIAKRSTLLRDRRDAGGDAWVVAIEVTRRRPRGSSNVALSATFPETPTLCFGNLHFDMFLGFYF